MVDDAEVQETMRSKQRLRGSAPRGLAVVAVLVAAFSGRSASADIIYNVSTPINGTTPSGTLQASFVDKSAGVVELKMTSNLSATGEFVMDWGFNVVPTFTDFAHLAISKVSTTNATFANTAVAGPTDDANTFNPSSIGKFDVLFDWKGSNHGFGPGGVVVYDFKYTGSQTFDTATFVAQSTGGSVPLAPFYTAAKIAGIPSGGQSGELGNVHGPLAPTPEPSSLALGFLGIVVCAATAWQRRNRRAT